MHASPARNRLPTPSTSVRTSLHHPRAFGFVPNRGENPNPIKREYRAHGLLGSLWPMGSACRPSPGRDMDVQTAWHHHKVMSGSGYGQHLSWHELLTIRDPNR